MADTPVVLMDLFLTCSGPENLSGVLFQRAQLDNCVKPSVMTSATKITSPLGSNVLLRCDATGLPTPALYWEKSDGSPVNNTGMVNILVFSYRELCLHPSGPFCTVKLHCFVLQFNICFHSTVQESPGEGVRWSIMSLDGILYKDAGDYRCKAKNDAGSTEATISLSVAGASSTTIPPLNSSIASGPSSQDSTFSAPTDIPNVTAITSTLLLKISTTIAPMLIKPSTSPSNSVQKSSSKQGKPKPGGNGKKFAADEKSKKSDAPMSVKDLKIVEETSDTAVLLWTADGLPKDALITVVYSPYGEDDSKRTIETNVGSGKVFLEGLSSGMRYSVCLVAKGSAPGKDPCIDFYTLDNVEDGGQNQLFMIISGVACALVLPLIALLLYKILVLYCKGRTPSLDEAELEKDSYVKFETISMKQRTLNPNRTEIWARRPTRESERMLLCSRSSIDSQMTYKSDSSRSEYLC